MQANLYINNSDERYINKNLTTLLNNVELYFKDDEDILNPVLKVTSINDILGANYLYLNELDRYYYIRSVTYSKQYVLLNCEVDVLMSHKRDLLIQEVILKRQSNKYNLYQDDNEFRVLQYEAIRTQEFPSGFSPTTQAFVLGVVGNTSITETGGNTNV